MTNQTRNYLQEIANLLERNQDILTRDSDAHFTKHSFEMLKAENHRNYEELLECYDTSLANPDYATELYGSNGPLVSAIYTDYRSTIIYAYQKNDIMFKHYLDFYHKIKTETIDNLQESYHEFKRIILEDKIKYDLSRKASINTKTQDWLNKADFTDLRYLFRYGSYITDNEIKTAEFLNNYNADELEELMDITAKAYVNGFKVDGKDVSLRDNVHILYNIGQEKMIHVLKAKFKSLNLNGFYGGSISTSANKQYDYDHRFDNGLYLDEKYKEETIKIYENSLNDMQNDAYNYSGIMYFDKFGEKPFEPLSKDNNISLTDKQTQYSQKIQSKKRLLNDSYFKSDETSFCIIAFPVPEIGEKFEEIYADTCLINKLSSDDYLPIQETIINALDKCQQVHIKGIQGNDTDIVVQHQLLKLPEKETNYFNCGADVNIPVGEVFTSPQLKGTNGILHLDVVYLNDLKFIDLKLEFKDGYIVKYDCKNFDSSDKNKVYIEENLLFPHKTLPLGEFAIGTNTLAYVVAEKYQITDILPILIVEKMGPHFAIGDTCYTFSEDLDVYNPDGKCIMSRDNEHSIIRKEDMSKAYTNVHTDITLPYDSLAFIKGIHKHGEIMIIENGRFVLEGTEKLNQAFKKLS